MNDIKDTNAMLLGAYLSSRGQTAGRQADPGPAQEQRTLGSPREDGYRSREGSAERRRQSLSASLSAGMMRVPPECSQAAREGKVNNIFK